MNKKINKKKAKLMLFLLKNDKELYNMISNKLWSIIAFYDNFRDNTLYIIGDYEGVHRKTVFVEGCKKGGNHE